MKIWIYWSNSNSWIHFYIYLNKNCKIYWSEQSFTGLGPEDRCSSRGLCPKPGSGFLTRYVVELLSSLFKHTFHMVVTCLRPLYIHVYINKFIQLVMFVVNIQSCYQIVVKQNAILESVLVQKGQLQYNIMVAILLKKDPKAWMVNDKMTLWKESLNSGGQ